MSIDNLVHEPAVWVAVALIIFVALLAKFGFPKIAGSLDDYGNKIKKEIEEAKTLKAEAEALLQAAQRKSTDAERTAREIVERAKFDAKLIADESEKEIEREIERKMKIADEKIKSAENAAVEHIRGKAVEIAINAASEILQKELESEKNSEKLVEKSLRLISGNIA